MSNPVKALRDIIHALIVDVATNFAIGAAMAAYPWLAWPGINPFFRFVVKRYTGFLSEGIELTAVFELIDARASAEAKAYQDSIEELKTAHAKGDSDDLQKATAKARAALGDLIRTHRN